MAKYIKIGNFNFDVEQTKASKKEQFVERHYLMIKKNSMMPRKTEVEIRGIVGEWYDKIVTEDKPAAKQTSK